MNRTKKPASWKVIEEEKDYFMSCLRLLNKNIERTLPLSNFDRYLIKRIYISKIEQGCRDINHHKRKGKFLSGEILFNTIEITRESFLRDYCCFDFSAVYANEASWIKKAQNSP